MFQFPDGLYTDVRIEDVFESKIQITLKNLENMKEQSYRAAFIRVFDGGRWYYAATTSSDNVQGEIDRLATMATKNHSICDHYPCGISISQWVLLRCPLIFGLEHLS